jgi:histidine triad (HIT) family protein
MLDCIFCKIIDKHITAHIVFENDVVLAILDINQSTIGHTLVIPKGHHENFLLTPKEEMLTVMEVAQKIAKKQMETLHAKGVNILMNSYPAAGQTVMHFHVHLIPRYNDDDQVKIELKKHLDISTLDLQSIAAKFALKE